MTRDEIIKSAVDECEREAHRQGWTGGWTLQPADLDYIAAELRDAGLATPSDPERRRVFTAAELDRLGVPDCYWAAWLAGA